MFEQYDDILTIEELCEMLNIGRNKSYDLVCNREIEACKIGKSWKVPKDNVIEFIKKKCKN